MAHLARFNARCWSMASTGVLSVTLTCMLWAVSSRGDQIVNGDFQTGLLAPSSTTYSQSSVMTPQGTWNIVSFDTIHGSWVDYYDHTYRDSTGWYMIVNGTTTGAGPVWRQTVDVVPNTQYALTAWFASLHPDAIASLEFRVLDEGTLTALSTFTAPSTLAVWEDRGMTFGSGDATSLSIEIWDTNLIGGGNDYSIDDVSLTVVPEPGTLALLSLGVASLGARRRKAASRGSSCGSGAT